MSVTDNGPVRAEPRLDPRGVRFSAALTSVVLALVLVSSSGWLAAAQAVVFGSARSPGCGSRPTACSTECCSRPGWVPPAEREDAAPVRFSQTVGLVFAVVAHGRLPVRAHRARARRHRVRAGGRPLNAVFGFCLGCEMYALLARLRAPRAPAPEKTPCTTHNTGSYRIMSRQDVLVTADWAEKNLDTDGIVFLEVDEDTTAYDGGHIPGAVKVNWTDELQDPVRRDIVTKEQFEQLLSAKGVGQDDKVVLYGGNNNWFAAYAYWEFKLYGHHERHAARRRPQEVGARRPHPDHRRQATARPRRTRRKDADTSIRAFRDEVVDAIGNKNLVDVRSPDEFSGKILAPAHLPQEQSQRPGHIPSAINIPWRKAANEDGTFKSDEELAELYGEAGYDEGRPTIAYCRIGERSQPHLGRAARAARPLRRQELRRQLDRVRLADRRADRTGSEVNLMCGAPDQAVALPAGTDLSKETVLAGRVVAGGEPVGGAFVRLLDGTGEFTAEVVSSASGTSGSSPRPGTLDRAGAVPRGQRPGRAAARGSRPAPGRDRRRLTRHRAHDDGPLGQ